MSGGLGGALRENARRQAGLRVRAQRLRAPETEGPGRRIARAAPEDPLFRGTVIFLTCLHELGRAFGLRHTDALADIICSGRHGDDFLTHFMRFREELDRREDGVPGILADTRSLSGRTPDCTMIDESEL